MNKQTWLAIAVAALSMPALAGHGAWLDKSVQVRYGGKLVTGKTVRSMGCLYVKFDQPQAGGVTMARIADSVESLQLRTGNGWVPQDLLAIRRSEAAECLAEANG